MIVKNILITGPSMDNVSGIAEVVRNIKKFGTKNYIHFITGSKDGEKKNLHWLIKQFRLYKDFYTALNYNDIDIIHLNTALNPLALLRDLPLAIISKIKNKKLLIHVHGGQFINYPPNIVFNKIIKLIFHYSDHIIVLSKIEKTKLADEYSTGSVTILENCVDCCHSKNFIEKQSSAQYNAIYLGRIEKDKGIFETIDALEMLKKKGINIKFTLCGTGSIEKTVITRLKDILGQSFVYQGVVTGNNKWNIIRQSDFFLLPSYFEGLPMALLECMSVGVIPIVTDVGSIPIVVENGSNGYLVPKYDSHAIADKLEIIISNLNLKREMSANAYKTTRKFCCERYLIQLENIYDS